MTLEQLVSLQPGEDFRYHGQFATILWTEKIDEPLGEHSLKVSAAAFMTQDDGIVTLRSSRDRSFSLPDYYSDLFHFRWPRKNQL